MKTQKQFDGVALEKIIATGVTLLDFNAPWCAPCRAQEPIIQALAQKFNNTAKVKLGFFHSCLTPYLMS